VNNPVQSQQLTSPGGAVHYRTRLLVRFGHCDPAGIVFYPRYLEMFNDIIEDWCREDLKFSFPEIVGQRGWGLPTVHLDVDFVAPSFYGETLSAALSLLSVGASSMRVQIVMSGPNGEDRLRGQVVLVLMDRRTYRSIPIPEDVRARLTALQAAQ
jgi:4-hydroxybenzoyl-CoA thioesterase